MSDKRIEKSEVYRTVTLLKKYPNQFKKISVAIYFTLDEIKLINNVFKDTEYSTRSSFLRDLV